MSLGVFGCLLDRMIWISHRKKQWIFVICAIMKLWWGLPRSCEIKYGRLTIHSPAIIPSKVSLGLWCLLLWQHTSSLPVEIAETRRRRLMHYLNRQACLLRSSQKGTVQICMVSSNYKICFWRNVSTQVTNLKWLELPQGPEAAFKPKRK